jgi:hypothetical protein
MRTIYSVKSQPSTTPIPAYSGRNLAHGHRDSGQRGALAAQLVLGEAKYVKPTITQAVAITGANTFYVRWALELKPATRAHVVAGDITLVEAVKANGLLTAWASATPAEKAALGVAVGVNEIWDSATQPSI